MAGREKEGKVALVQLCDVDIILLVHVSKMESVYTVSITSVSGVPTLVQDSPERSK